MTDSTDALQIHESPVHKASRPVCWSWAPDTPPPTTPTKHHQHELTVSAAAGQQHDQPAQTHRCSILDGSDHSAVHSCQQDGFLFNDKTVRKQFRDSIDSARWLGSRVVSMLGSGAERTEFKSQPRRCRVTVLGKLFTPIVPLFDKQQNW